MNKSLVIKRTFSAIAATLVLGFAGPIFADYDAVSPTVSAVVPTAVAVGSATTFSATFYDSAPSSGVQLCQVVLDGGTLLGLMSIGSNPTAGTGTFVYSFSYAGTHTLNVQCKDNQNNWGYGAVTTITVGSSYSSDNVLPIVGTISPFSVTPWTTTSVSAAYSDNLGVTSCNLYVNGMNQGSMSLTGSRASRDYYFAGAGSYSMQVRCYDAVGNEGISTATITTGSSSDFNSPSVGQIQQGAATIYQPITLTASYSDNVGVTSCDLYVNGVNQGAMTLYGSYAQRNSYVFSSYGSYTVYALCRDAAGYTASGASRTLTVGMTGSSVAFGSLIKQSCPAYAAADHACKAVYYYGSDGKRHAFSNEKVYFTWYTNFSTVQEVSDVAMSNIPLGTNVNYRPGVRMVKFQSVPKVYAIGRYGVLRWVTSPQLAISMYGTNWSQNVDDVSEAFYTNYTFGADIVYQGQFVPASESAAAYSIDANLLP